MKFQRKMLTFSGALFIKQYESEPYHQHQGVVRRYINTLMNLTGAPTHCWLLCLVYVCSLLNVTASSSLDGIITLQALTGQVPDISYFLHFSFWEPVYYKVDENESDHRFPSQSNEKGGHWVGFADNKGDHLTWKILTDETQQIITRYVVRSANKTTPNLRLDPPKGRINHKICHLKYLFMVGLILMDLKSPLSCPPPTLMTFRGELSYFLWMRMGRGREPPYLIISILLIKLKFPEKKAQI